MSEEMLTNEQVVEQAQPIASEGQAQNQPAVHHRHNPRSAEELHLMKNRLNRMIGQLNGIGRMIEEDRYCGDVLIQISAVQRALQNFGYMVLESHVNDCVLEEVQQGNLGALKEALELMKSIK